MSFNPFCNPLSRVFSPFGIGHSAPVAAPAPQVSEELAAPVINPEANTFYIVLFDPVTDKPVMTAHKIFEAPAQGIPAPVAETAEAEIAAAPAWLAPSRDKEDALGFGAPALA